MLGAAVIVLSLLPTVVFCAGEGNIRLLEDEVAVALKACSEGEDPTDGQKQKRSSDGDDGNRQDSNSNPDGQEWRNASDGGGHVEVEHDGSGGAGAGSVGAAASTGSDVLAGGGGGSNRTRRSEPLFNKADNDQCLSQCVFANLQVVDSRGIPREAQLWSRVQASVTSQQSRAALRDQLAACFQELQSEAEDNGCSYSNKLERCLMLRFSDRRPTGAHTAIQP